MATKVNDVIKHFENLYASGAIYVWGADCQIITKELTDYLYNTYGSKTYDRAYYDGKLKEGLGKIGADCSGSFTPVSNLNNTAQQYYNTCSVKGHINYIDRAVPCLVFKGSSPTAINHVGFYCGNGYVIEMQSSKANCVKKTLDAGKWNYFGVPKWIDYSMDPVFGIDVSSIQKTIDFNQVKSAGYQFVILRTVLKNGSIDTKFATNYAAAKKAGLKVGAYILSYATTEMDAITSAQKVISAVGDTSVPIFLDLEKDGGQFEKIGKAGITRVAKAFIQTCTQYKYQCYIYCNVDWYNNVIDTSLKQYAIWIARYGKNDGKYTTAYKPNVGEKIWQFTSKGQIPGISGNVDTNACYDMSIFGSASPAPVKVTSEPIHVVGVVKVSDYLNIREAPDNNARVVGRYNAREIVQLTEKTSNGWYKTASGYVSAKYVEFLTGTPTNCNKVNVRQMPTKESASLRILYPEKDKFIILAGMGEWFNVLLNDNTIGWIKRDYVRFLNL